MDTGDLCRVPQAAVRLGRARQSSGTGPCGDYRRVMWLPGPQGQYSGTIRFIEKNGVQDEAKRSSEHRVAYPEVKDLVRILGSVAPLLNGGLIPRENSF